MSTTRSRVLTTGRVDPCVSSPCHNGGGCISYGRHYSCRCPSSFYGPRCDVAHNLTAFHWTFTTPRADITTTVRTPNVPLSAAVTSVVVVVILMSIFVACCLRTAKKRRNLQLARGSLAGMTLSASGHHQTNTRDRFMHLFEHASNQNIHRVVESGVDGGSVNYGYEPARDLPPPYLSVVAEPKIIIEEDNSLELPPSYDEALAATRPTPAPSDARDTSPDRCIMTSQKENTSSEPTTTSTQGRNMTSLEGEVAAEDGDCR